MKTPIHIIIFLLHGSIMLSFIPLCLSTSHAASIDKSGVAPTVISLPTGPGSMEGLGLSFEPQLNTGTATYSVKIIVPEGINGHEPQLALVYNSGYGNSPFGLGWSLDISYIQRMTDKGIPLYNYQDTFIYQGEELVPLPDPVYGKTYRLKNESGFMRIAQIGDHWEVTDRSGVLYRFGMYPDGVTPARTSRIGKAGKSFSQTFRWCLDEIIDTNGNKIEYYYIGFPDSPGQIYISRICYNKHGSASHEVHFYYEQRPDPYTDYRSGFRICTSRRCTRICINSCGKLVRRYVLGYRKDPSDIIYHATNQGIPLGFSLLHQIAQYDNTQLVTDAGYLPPMRFAYTPFDPNNARVRCMSNPPPYSLGLTSTQIVDINGDGLPDIVHTSPIEGHLYYLNQGSDTFSNGQRFKHYPPIFLDNPGVQLADLDGDGLCDLIQKAGGESGIFQFFPNLNRFDRVDDSDIGWGDEIPYDYPYPPMDDVHACMVDLDFDKKTDFMKVTQAGVQYYFNKGQGWSESDFYLFGESILADMGPQIQFVDGDGKRNPYIRMADMNGDRLQDIVSFILMGNQLEVSYWPNMGWGRWDFNKNLGEGITIPSVEAEDLLLFDVNGDGLSDLVAVDNGTLFFWVNLGSSWSQGFTVSDTPTYIRGTTILRQADMNGNGTTDLVWENWENPEDCRIQYLDFVGRIKSQLLCLIDNGLGRQTSIEYRASTRYYVEARQKGNPWRMKVPFPVPLVSRITTTCGLDLDNDPNHHIDQYITDILYRDGFYDSAEREFRGFSFVKRIRWGDSTAPTQVTRYCFHTGAPDGIDNDEDGATDEKGPEGEWEDEPLKGVILWSETTGLISDPDGDKADDAGVFERIINTWKIKVIHAPDSGNPLFPDMHTLNQQSVAFTYIREETKEIIEANQDLHMSDPYIYPTRSPKILKTTYEYDYLGNKVREFSFGEDQPESNADDERFSYTDYIYNLKDWIIDRPYKIKVTDEDGHFISKKRYYYDGEDFVGLPLGQIGNKGNIKREEQVVIGFGSIPPLEQPSSLPGDPRLPAGYAINKARNAHDQFGNINAILDPRGNLMEISYDETFYTFPLKEIIHLEDGNSPLIVYATYDYGFGVMVSSTNFNGHTTSYKYDSFGRLAGIVKPGDTLQFPTQRFHYRAADPLRGCFYDYDDTGHLTISYSNTNQIASAVITRAREFSGEPGTMDTIQYTDGMGRKLATIEEGDEEGEFVVKDAVTYNLAGQIKEEFMPYFSDTGQYQVPLPSYPKSTNYYDPMERNIKRVTPPDAEGRVHFTQTVYLPLEKHVYDEEDTDPNSHHYWTPTVYLTDGLDRLVEVWEMNHDPDLSIYITRYTWDLLEDLVMIEDNQNNIKMIRYDCLGRKIFMNDPDRGRMYYTYDDTGNLIKTCDNKGQIVKYTYDAANRTLTEDCNEDTNRVEVSYYYDTQSSDHPEAANLKGQLSYVLDQSGAEYCSYDERGNALWIIKKINVNGKEKKYKTSMTYDSLDRIHHYTYPDGKTITYIYNARSLLKTIPHFVTNISYKASGSIDIINYANGVQTGHDYDPRQRLIRLKTEGESEYPFQDLSYHFDGVSNILRIQDQRTSVQVTPGDADQGFSYDDLYRLTSAEGPGYGMISYRYDSIGNMIHKASPSEGFTGHIHDPLINLGEITNGGIPGITNRVGRNPGGPPGPHAVTGTASGLFYDYDDNGNMNNANGDRYLFDYKDRLVKILKEDSEADYIYDYSGRRIMKQIKEKRGTPEVVTRTTLYISKDYEIREEKAIGYVFAGDRRIAQWEGTIDPGELSQTIHLLPSWNLISTYMEPDDPSIDAVFSSIAGKYQEVWTYDTINEKYLRYNPDLPKGENDIQAIEPLRGYLVLMNDEAILTVSGSCAKRAITLYPGWNLIGYPSTVPQGTSSFLSSLGGNYKSAWCYRADLEKWEKYLSEKTAPSFLNDLDQMESGFAYWVDVSQECALSFDEWDDAEIFFYHPDHLGSSNAVTDRKGKLAESTEFYPFGRLRYEKSNDFDSVYKYTGKERDKESGLMYFGARYYEMVAGRFLSVDPLFINNPKKDFMIPQKLNLYSYVNNNPVKFIDPLGLEGWHPDVNFIELSGSCGLFGGLTTGLNLAINSETGNVSLFALKGIQAGLEMSDVALKAGGIWNVDDDRDLEGRSASVDINSGYLFYGIGGSAFVTVNDDPKNIKEHFWPPKKGPYGGAINFNLNPLPSATVGSTKYEKLISIPVIGYLINPPNTLLNFIDRGSTPVRILDNSQEIENRMELWKEGYGLIQQGLVPKN